MLRLPGMILALALGPRRNRFRDALRHPQEAQRRLLRDLVRALSATDYGRAHDLRAGDEYDAFAAKLPPATYDDLRPWVERQQRTEARVLAPEPVLFYEKSSGSSGPAKFIPYTRSLKASFNRMFLLWLGDLLTNGPGFRTGKLFLSISPAFRQPEQTARGVRVGLADDTEYLDGWARALLAPFLVAPPAVARILDPFAFKRTLCALLLAEPRLETVSIWNPTLFDLLLDFAEEHRDPVLAALSQGELSIEGQRLRVRRPSAERLALLRAPSLDWTRIWPDLKLLSCWTSAHAAPAARSLQARLPHARLQGKGLLATEAPMTMPWIEADGFVPLPSEVFYEFLDEDGRVRLLHELRPGSEYEVMLTQRGGLSRYRIGDRVRVTHVHLGSPCLEFTGRADAVSDLVGEKLNEAFVRDCLARLSPAGGVHCLLPILAADRAPAHYLLLSDRDDLAAPALEAALQTAFHYRTARLLGQLGPVQVRVAPSLRETYYAYFENKGMKWGDIKHRLLLRAEDAEGLLGG